MFRQLPIQCLVRPWKRTSVYPHNRLPVRWLNDHRVPSAPRRMSNNSNIPPVPPSLPRRQKPSVTQTTVAASIEKDAAPPAPPGFFTRLVSSEAGAFVVVVSGALFVFTLNHFAKMATDSIVQKQQGILERQQQQHQQQQQQQHHQDQPQLQQQSQSAPTVDSTPNQSLVVSIPVKDNSESIESTQVNNTPASAGDDESVWCVGIELASLLRRSIAWQIDTVLLHISNGLILFCIWKIFPPGGHRLLRKKFIAFFSMDISLQIIYEFLCLWLLDGQTIGKALTHLRVRKRDYASLKREIPLSSAMDMDTTTAGVVHSLDSSSTPVSHHVEATTPILKPIDAKTAFIYSLGQAFDSKFVFISFTPLLLGSLPNWLPPLSTRTMWREEKRMNSLFHNTLSKTVVVKEEWFPLKEPARTWIKLEREKQIQEHMIEEQLPLLPLQ
jgi:hypothetical protein